MKIYLVAGGPSQYIPNLKDFHQDDVIWIGIDRGVRYLLNEDIQPSIAIGDFDSILSTELELFRQVVPTLKIFKPEKDETDMELALRLALEKNPVEMKIFGATGGRLDHLFANIHLLSWILKENPELSVEVIDRQNIVFVRKPGTYHLPKIFDMKYVSFIPLSEEVKDLTLVGFKYPLKNRNILFSSTLCISNELILDYGTFSFSEGILMVVRSRDD